MINLILFILLFINNLKLNNKLIFEIFFVESKLLLKRFNIVTYWVLIGWRILN